MDAVKFIKERDRMCKSYYDTEKGHCSDGCPVHDVQCTNLDNLSTDAEELVARVEEWSAAHPRKTRQRVFLEQWPEAKVFRNSGILALCPAQLRQEYRDDEGRCVRDTISGDICDCCRHEFWSQEVE